MALPAWSFVLVGAFVVFMSYNNAKLILFFYLGLAFLVWGIFKLSVGYLLKQPTPVEERVIERKIQPEIVACPYCGAAVYTTARFCHECGGQLKT